MRKVGGHVVAPPNRLAARFLINERQRAKSRVAPDYVCSGLAGPRLADVEIVLAAVAAAAIGPTAFINEMAMTVALSQFSIAFRRRGERGTLCRRHQGKGKYCGRDSNMRHANSPASLECHS